LSVREDVPYSDAKGEASLYVGARGLGVVRALFQAFITLSIVLSVVRLVGASGNPALQGAHHDRSCV